MPACTPDSKTPECISLSNLEDCPHCKKPSLNPPTEPAESFEQITDVGAPENQLCYLCNGPSNTRKTCCQVIAHDTCLNKLLETVLQHEGQPYKCPDCNGVACPPYTGIVSLSGAASSKETVEAKIDNADD